MANDRHPILVTIFDRSGRKKITAYDDSMWGWPNEEGVTDYVMSYPAKKYPDNVVEVVAYGPKARGDLPLTAESLRWRFRTGSVAGQTSVRLLRKSRTAALHHATKKSSAQLQREINEALRKRAMSLDPAQVGREITAGFARQSALEKGLTPAQRAYIAASVEDVRLFPDAYKAEVRADPHAWAVRLVEGLSDADAREMAREQRAETKRTLRALGRS